MALTDDTYYKRSDRHISNVFETESDGRKDLNHYINTCEKSILKRAFGREMYRDFYQYVGKGGLDSNAPQNYKDIVYGKDYYIDLGNGETELRVWNGLIDRDLCTSLLADYTYYQFWQDNVTTTTSEGEVKNSGKVSDIQSMSSKLTRAYNRFLSAFQGGYNHSLYHGGNCNVTPYEIRYNRLKNGIWLDYYSDHDNEDVSLLTFLHESNMIDDQTYPLLSKPYMFDAGLKYKNEFGL